MKLPQQRPLLVKAKGPTVKGWVLALYICLPLFCFLAGTANAQPPRPPGIAVAWGEFDPRLTNFLVAQSNLVDVYLNSGTLVLRADGSVAAWSTMCCVLDNVPPNVTNIVGVACGASHGLALRADGSVAAWGSNFEGVTNVPTTVTNVAAIAAGTYQSLALRQDGKVFAWGLDPGYGVTNVPTGLTNAIAIAAGDGAFLGLKEEGTVFGWGFNNYGQANPPIGLADVVAVAAGQVISLALRRDGRVIAWGYGVNGGLNVPANLSNVVAIAAGGEHGLALKRDGTVVAWGYNAYGQATVPLNLTNVTLVRASAHSSLALVGDGSLSITVQPSRRAVFAGRTVMFSVMAAGAPPITYQWRFNGTNMAAATNYVLTLTNVQAADIGSYSVVLNNPKGTVISALAPLNILDSAPLITAQPQSAIAVAGTDPLLSCTALGTFPLSYQWRFNGSNLSGATNATLMVGNAQLTNIGSYTVVVANSFGAVTSSVAFLSVRFSLTFLTNGNGGVIVNPALATYTPASVVSLRAVPGVGYAFNAWSGDADASENPLSVTMTNNKTITVNFSPVISIATQGAGTVTKAPEKPFYSPGEQVALTGLPGRWYGFSSWADGPAINPRIVTIGTNNNYTAIFSPTTAVETLTFSNVSRTAPIGMPALFVDGQFAVSNSITRSDTATISMHTTFTNGAIFFTLDGSTPSIASSLYTGPFVQRRSVIVRAFAYDAGFLNSWEADPVELIILPAYLLNASTAGGGSVSLTPQAETAYQSNTLVTFVAIADPGWTFLQWIGDATGTNATNTIRVTQTMCAQAVFGTMLGSTVVGNGTVIVDPAPALYPYGTLARFTAVPQSGNFFGAWGNAVASTNNPLFFRVTNANPVVSCFFANLSAGQVTLTVLVSGHGNVATTPRGNRFPINQSVSLVAAPEPGQRFLNWTGDASSTATNLTVSLTQSKIVTANFTKRPQLILGPCFGGWRREGFQVVLTAEFGTSYRIEKSGDLIHWLLLERLTNAYGTTQTIDTVVTNGGAQFYRAVEDSTFP